MRYQVLIAPSSANYHGDRQACICHANNMTLQHIPAEIRGEFTISNSGRVTVSRRGLARLCGVDEKSIRGLLERAKGAELKGFVTLQSLAGQSFEVRSLDLRSSACILAYYAFEAGRNKSDVAAKNLMKIPVEYHPQLPASEMFKRSGGQAEKIVQRRLSGSLGGKIEVLTPVGKIDVLTSTEIIEVKVASSWKGALGQIIAYGYFYPSHQKRIHLYGAAHSDSKSYIEKICKASDVVVTWE